MRRTFLVVAILTLLARVSMADLSVRECIKGAPDAERWELAGDGVWRTMLTLGFNNVVTSDIVAQAAVVYTEGPGQTGVKVEYEIVLDGTPSFVMQHRPNTGFPTAKMLRASFANVVAGQHLLEIRARNRSSFSAYFTRVWLGPLLVDGAEVTSTGSQSTAITTPTTNTWTTLVTTSITPGTGKAIILGAYSTVSAGPANQLIEYRILQGSTVVGSFSDGVSSYLPSGQHFAVLDRSPGTGTLTYSLPARTIGGAPTFVARQLFAQTIPGNLSVFEGSAANFSYPADAAWHNIASSGPTLLSSASVGTYGSRGFGFASVTYNGAYNSEALLQFNFIASKPWEVGVVYVHGTSGKTVMEGLISDWERLGFPTGTYSAELDGIGLCTSASSLGVKSARFQLIALPDNDGFVTPDVCATHPGTCCSDFPSCTLYTCTVGSLPGVSTPSTDCPLP